MIIDISNSVLGRVATVVAKKALLGETVHVVNCENAIITGSKARLMADFKQKRERGIPLKGPYYPKQSDRIVKRAIRGMLPYKKPKGREAFERIRCYVGVPAKFENQTFEKVEGTDRSKLPNLKYLYIKDIAKQIGGKL
ncbi:50S ribosomal protein L13 [Candidatus Woesearchaeota archaeon]|jgi:large subunit ribosomal protein L13|nr:50S ribosomal protein L13 [Candidatus Woesearchaeota archaeon]MBT7927937.1 50S ribosomal protein L13 [Candidatus Woesearchaeota archaeon]